MTTPMVTLPITGFRRPESVDDCGGIPLDSLKQRLTVARVEIVISYTIRVREVLCVRVFQVRSFLGPFVRLKVF